MVFEYIVWSAKPEIFKIGSFGLRWYGLLFATAFYVGFMIMTKIFKQERVDLKELDSLVLYMVLGTVLGARFGHCFFYDFDYYSKHPLDIIKVWEGGLASHGAAIGILIAMYLYTKKVSSKSFLWVADRIVITVALAAFFIRLGNLMNSEIIGKPSDLPWAFVFTRIDDLPRHPSQLYESFLYLIVFIIIYSLYNKEKENTKSGKLFGIFLMALFSIRFLIEFLKENQSDFESGMLLNMGQLLSIPFIILGAYLFNKAINQTKS
jgi:phosphatidylglycerol:prolipoprotein diacylglycerol transferase